MTTSDGFIINTTKIVDHGPTIRRFNLVILSEGYQKSEINKYHTDVQDFIDLFSVTRPFNRIWCTFNIYRVDVASTDSGIDNPAPSYPYRTNCDGTGKSHATYFDASFCNKNVSRSIGINAETVLSVAKSQVPNFNRVLVFVNSSKDGGTSFVESGNPSRDSIAIVSNAAAGWPAETAIHELGHAIAGLADEYPYINSCNAGADPATQNNYTGTEPLQPNITTVTNRTKIKWSSLISNTTPMPTKRNPDPTCNSCDNGASPVAAGTVGAFEGAGTFHCGLFRPEFDCKMRNLGVPFCQVCEQSILNTIHPISLKECTSRFKDIIVRFIVEGPIFVPPGVPPASIPLRFSWITKRTSTRVLDLGSLTANLFLITETGEMLDSPLYSVTIPLEVYITSGEYHSKTYSFALPANQALAIYKAPRNWRILRLVLQGTGVDGGPYYDDVPLFVTDQCSYPKPI